MTLYFELEFAFCGLRIFHWCISSSTPWPEWAWAILMQEDSKVFLFTSPQKANFY